MAKRADGGQPPPLNWTKRSRAFAFSVEEETYADQSMPRAVKGSPKYWYLSRTLRADPCSQRVGGFEAEQTMAHLGIPKCIPLSSAHWEAMSSCPCRAVGSLCWS